MADNPEQQPPKRRPGRPRVFATKEEYKKHRAQKARERRKDEKKNPPSDDVPARRREIPEKASTSDRQKQRNMMQTTNENNQTPSRLDNNRMTPGSRSNTGTTTPHGQGTRANALLRTAGGTQLPSELYTIGKSKVSLRSDEWWKRGDLYNADGSLRLTAEQAQQFLQHQFKVRASMQQELERQGHRLDNHSNNLNSHSVALLRQQEQDHELLQTMLGLRQPTLPSLVEGKEDEEQQQPPLQQRFDLAADPSEQPAKEDFVIPTATAVTAKKDPAANCNPFEGIVFEDLGKGALVDLLNKNAEHLGLLSAERIVELMQTLRANNALRPEAAKIKLNLISLQGLEEVWTSLDLGQLTRDGESKKNYIEALLGALVAWEATQGTPRKRKAKSTPKRTLEDNSNTHQQLAVNVCDEMQAYKAEVSSPIIKRAKSPVRAPASASSRGSKQTSTITAAIPVGTPTNASSGGVTVNKSGGTARKSRLPPPGIGLSSDKKSKSLSTNATSATKAPHVVANRNPVVENAVAKLRRISPHPVTGKPRSAMNVEEASKLLRECWDGGLVSEEDAVLVIKNRRVTLEQLKSLAISLDLSGGDPVDDADAGPLLLGWIQKNAQRQTHFG